MGFSDVFIIGVLILVGVVAAAGTGEEFGFLGEVNEFTTTYPSDEFCNWNETGLFTNMETDTACNLVIADTSTNALNVDLPRLDISTDQEWNTEYNARNNIQVNSTSNYGAYITPDTDGSASFDTSEFYLDSGASVDFTYQYQEITAPGSIEVVLYSLGNGQQDSVTLSPGVSSNEYEQTATLSTSQSSQHELRLDIGQGDEDEQRIFSYYVSQPTDEIQGATSGLYQSNNVLDTEEVELERVEFLGNDITGIGVQDQRTSILEITGYSDGNVVDTFEARTEGDITVAENIFQNQSIDSYSFNVIHASTTTQSPKFSSLYIEGSTTSRYLGDTFSQTMSQIVFLIFLGMGLLYGAARLKSR